MTSTVDSIPTFYPKSDRHVKRLNYPPMGYAISDNLNVDNQSPKYLRLVLARNVRRYMANDPSIRRQEALEAKSGLGQSTVSRVLNCGGAATLDTVEALARAIGCQPWELLIDDDAMREQIVQRYLRP